MRVRVVPLLAAILAGCGFTVGHLASVTATGAAPAAGTPAGTRHVVGRDCVPIIVVAPTRYPSLTRATDDALAGSPGRTLTDVVIRYELRYIQLVYGTGCYAVEGIAQ